MDDNRILVTGGAGFIGSHVCANLLSRGDSVICLDNFNDFYPPAFKRANIASLHESERFILAEGDIRDREFLSDVFHRFQPDRVIHLAAMANVRYSIVHPAIYVDVNVRGTANLLDASVEASVGHFVLASTSSVYGSAERIPFREEDDTDHPLAPYPATKKACEVLAHAYSHVHELPMTVLRFFTVYGPNGRPDMTPFMFMKAISEGQPITLFDAGEMRRDFTYIDDIVNGVIRALDAPEGYQIYNLGRGKPVVMRDFVAIIEKLVGKEAIIREVPAPAGEPSLTYADVSRAKEKLGYEPKVSIDEGLTEMWEWYQAR